MFATGLTPKLEMANSLIAHFNLLAGLGVILSAGVEAL